MSDHALNILLVEDDDAVRLGLCSALSKQGYSVSPAATVSDALQCAAKNPPDVVICDWQLHDPQGDGVDVASRVRADTGASVILVTARSIDELRSRAAGLSVAKFLRKPIPLQQIFDAVQYAAVQN